MPNFLIIGAAKAGTTSLYYYLNQHPEIYMSPLKEPHFFGFEGEELKFIRTGNIPDPINTMAITDLESYIKLFVGVTTEKAIGEASPSYLHTPKAADRIKFYLPQAKLIAILRNPVDRAFSAFTGQYLHGIQNHQPHLTDFGEALKNETQYIQENWTPIYFYKQLGFYYSQLSYYYKLFAKEQIHVCLNDDLKKDSQKTLKTIFQYLGVDDTFSPDTSQQVGASGVPRNNFLYRFIKNEKVKSVLKPLVPKGWGYKAEKAMLNKPKMDPKVRQELLNLYRDDVLKLQDLIDRDLSAWLQ
jgi:hypothetical protein